MRGFQVTMSKKAAIRYFAAQYGTKGAADRVRRITSPDAANPTMVRMRPLFARASARYVSRAEAMDFARHVATILAHRAGRRGEPCRTGDVYATRAA